ncbi:50S ribosomal protein L10 [bacterium CG2_30_40_12]|nr:MAG: 50S ribosomal protein L10 [bacterium CG2_30_40_12]OJI08550.1 MAG: 50S ribosomal protein L10 [bacterium CG09_39_24]PIP04608.1 MAG: 50S ribosomal protein L10 [candidate division WWE3 bacterium CG23_combo_of_CG06-09_8_20_14_all_40_14]PJE52183.1 MAG: 50S ribosomal protein L10 [candidate division WWE3 bacterium CG10_big_fil_rev_8_21_14_0_10_39_14]
MPLKREKKEQILKILKDKISSSKSLVFFDYQNIATVNLNGLRDKLFYKSASLSVFKNTLLKKAFDKNLSQELTGPTAVLFAGEDPVEPIKELYEFKKEHETLNIKFGVLDGAFISQNQVNMLAELPAKQELAAKVVEGLSSPVRSLVGVLSGAQKKFITVLQQMSTNAKEV